MASEATDMRCKESIESNPGLTIRLRPFFSRAQHSRHRTKSHLAIVNAMRHCYTLIGRSVHHQRPARRREHSDRAFRY